jgi:starch synthase
MKVALSVIGKFHTFDLARALHQAGHLQAIFTGYPRFKLRDEQLPDELIHTFPWLHTPFMAMSNKPWMTRHVADEWQHLSRTLFDRHVASRLPACDVFVGLSSCATLSGRAAHRQGTKYVCDRGSTHIREQDALLKEEHERWGMPYQPIDPRTLACEEAEYAEADVITVPSHFNKQSFVKHGIQPERVHVLPYGVNLSRFHPVSTPAASRFDVIFVGGMSIRKGVPDLVKAFMDFKHPGKRLSFVGAPSAELITGLRARNLWSDNFRVLGHIPQEHLKEVMSQAHVMVLPSIEEGLALVQAQAMACGCPIIATTHTGAQDLFEDGVQGHILPIRRPDLITEKLQALADQPNVRAAMGQRALARVQQAGGWSQYGNAAIGLYRSLLAQPAKS